MLRFHNLTSSCKLESISISIEEENNIDWEFSSHPEMQQLSVSTGQTRSKYLPLGSTAASCGGRSALAEMDNCDGCLIFNFEIGSTNN